MATMATLLSAVVLWYVLRGLSHWWTGARRVVGRLSPWTARLHAWVLSAPATFGYIAIFTASTLVQRTAPPKLIDLLTKLQSTSIHHLNRAPVLAMAESALWVADKGAGFSLYVVLFATVVAWAERRYGTPRIIVIAVTGHVLGTLLTVMVEKNAIDSGEAPSRLAFTTDVGVSYMMVAGCVAAVILMRGRWLVAGGAALCAGVLGPVIIAHSLWNLGHLFATLSGLAAALVALRFGPPRTPPDLAPLLARAATVQRAAEEPMPVRARQ